MHVGYMHTHTLTVDASFHAYVHYTCTHARTVSIHTIAQSDHTHTLSLSLSLSHTPDPTAASFKGPKYHVFYHYMQKAYILHKPAIIAQEKERVKLLVFATQDLPTT